MPGLALDGEEARLLAALSLGFRKSIPISALKFIRRASEQWSRGEKALAHFELAYARLPRFECPEDARPLFFADAFLKHGISPYALMLSRGLDTGQLDLLKYSPDQPRVPAGHGRASGEWTAGQADGSSSDSQADDHPVEPFIQLAAANDWRNLPVNLMEDEAPNGPGHTISEHVGKTDAELIERADKESIYRFFGLDDLKKRVGSFDSIENANDLVNRTLRAQADLVDRVASGQEEDDFIQYRFGFITGKESYHPSRKEFFIRKTYGVGVFIVHDARSPRGFRVITAFPKNFADTDDN